MSEGSPRPLPVPADDLFRLVAESSADVIWTMDFSGRFTYVSPSVLRLRGFTADEVMRQTLDEVLAPGSAEVARRGIAEALAQVADRGTFDGARLELEQPCKGSGSVWTEVTISPLRDASGATAGILGITRDITERHQADSELSVAYDLLEGAFSQTPMPMVLVSLPSGTVRVLNGPCRRLLGMGDVPEPVGRRYSSIAATWKVLAADGTEVPADEAPLPRALRGETLSGVEYTLVRADGTRRTVLASAGPIVSRSGQTIAAFAAFPDITERRLVDDELRAARDAAEAASRAKSAFLAHMSHEIRTPMAGVLGMAELLLETRLDAHQSELAETLRSSGEALLSILDDVLDLSKIEAGRLDLETIDFDLRTTLEGVEDLLAVRAAKKGIDLFTVVDPAVPARVGGDPSRLRQVLTNLVGNAIKFTEKGEVVLSVGVEASGDPGPVVRFEVRDSGIGVAEEKQGLLFTPFTQADSSVSRRFGGTGLGLSISRRIVEAMGGTIGFRSAPAQGSVFWFTVPFRPPQAPPPPVRRVQLEERRVLLVDAKEARRHRLRAGLAGCIRTLGEAASGEEAFRLLESGVRGAPWDVVVVDADLPDGAGEELARRVRADGRFGATSLLLLAPPGRPGDASRAAQAGFQGYLPRPVRQGQLRDALAAIVPEGGARPERLVTRHSLAEEGGRRARVLVVEDNETNRRIALALVAKLGYRADAAHHGRAALEALRREPYDAVLMDVQMPDVDGIEATRRIRRGDAGEAAARIPIVAMTARALASDREECLAAGMNDYVSKPVRPALLAEALARVLPERAVDAEPVAEEPAQEKPGPGFDRQALLERVAGDEELADEILGIFVADGSRQLEKVGQALSDGKLEALRKAAHALRGAAGNVAAADLHREMTAVEEAAAAGDARAAAVAFERASVAFARVRAAVEGSLGR